MKADRKSLVGNEEPGPGAPGSRLLQSRQAWACVFVCIGAKIVSLGDGPDKDGARQGLSHPQSDWPPLSILCPLRCPRSLASVKPPSPLAASLSGLPCLGEHSGSVAVVQLPSRVRHFAAPRIAARLPVPSLSPAVCPSSCPLSR